MEVICLLSFYGLPVIGMKLSLVIDKTLRIYGKSKFGNKQESMIDVSRVYYMKIRFVRNKMYSYNLA